MGGANIIKIVILRCLSGFDFALLFIIRFDKFCSSKLWTNIIAACACGNQVCGKKEDYFLIKVNKKKTDRLESHSQFWNGMSPTMTTLERQDHCRHQTENENMLMN